MVKRKGNFHKDICTLENVNIADKKARLNKGFRKVIEKHDSLKDFDNTKLVYDLWYNTFKTSEYTTFTIKEPKERLIYRLPYYPDRIAHHAIMNLLEPYWKKQLIRNTYSSIKDRGIHDCAKDVRIALDKYPDKTVYCLKMDVRKFYPSINHDILMSILERKIKDKLLISNLRNVVYSADGVPIGNYLSLYFANLYLTPFDHWIKQYCKFYFRYADDIVILHHDKNFLHNVLIAIKFYLHLNLKLELKPNYLIFPVDKRGIDFVGYVFYHTHTKIRKSIKQNIMRLVNRYVNKEIDLEAFKKSMCSYAGWLKHCNSKHLLLKILDLTGVSYSNWNGIKRPYSKGKIYAVEKRNSYTRIYYTLDKKSYYSDVKSDKFIKYANNRKTR